MKSNATRILVPMDFSEQSKEGLYQAMHLASRINAQVFPLHIIKAHTPPWIFLNEKERAQQILKIKETLENEAKNISTENDVEIIPVVAFGKLCDTILQQIEELNISLIVMGTTTADNIKKKIIGGNALRIVTEAKIPVITVKPGCAIKNPDVIVLPLDLSKQTREKVTDAIKWAKQFQSKVFAVSFSTTRDDAIVGTLQGQLRQVESFMREAGIDIETNFVLYKSGSQEEKLVEYIKQKDADMVIITTHQQLEIVRFFIGSFAQDVIHSAPVPVLSIVPTGTFKVISSMPGT